MSKSRPYRSMSVNDVDMQSLLVGHAGQACVIGIDVSKRELIAVPRWPDGSLLRPWKTRNPGEIGVLMEKLKVLGQGGRVTVAMESSGTYGDAFRQAPTGTRSEQQV